MRERFDLIKNYRKYNFFELFHMNKRCYHALMYDSRKYLVISSAASCHIIPDIILDG